VSEEDECSVAAAIYQCGKEKAPVVTEAIQTALTSDVLVPAASPDLNKLKFVIVSILGSKFSALCSK